MSPRVEVASLRRHLNKLAEEFDSGLSQRYALHFWTPEEPSLDERLRTNVVLVMRWLRLKPPAPPIPPPPPPLLEPWLTQLNHVDYSNATKPLLVWAVDIERDELRSACVRIRKLQTESPGWAPVLVTNIADFAFFSRLHWLVEYVPSMSEPADGYSEHKLRYLAWRYRDVPALPVTADIKEDMLLEDLLVD